MDTKGLLPQTKLWNLFGEEDQGLRSTWSGGGGSVSDAIEKAKKRREIINKGAL
eukprot:CAMPEP_0118660350 /NCGR_PEP_ID=MMETSP0785-20121206/15629_1 /TAXON_ID=91992 /ORGANISM="Bolidomonas pacifica, Strain CCMP 1866" /LENGTH=53 /DNA_ID=CAMNT_0006553577 /DNA_START=83 /DNA_END=241 /DNA_ORIENTATION=+